MGHLFDILIDWSGRRDTNRDTTTRKTAKKETPAENDGRLKSLVFMQFFAYLKYLFSRPSNALPWRASSLAISWTVSWIAS